MGTNHFTGSGLSPEPVRSPVPLVHALRPPSVLIVNDQEWTARSLESILAPEGYDVQRAYTGAQALQHALSQPPDLIILDMSLPDISGPDVCRQVREDGRIGPWTPILLTTAGTAGRARELEALEAGAWDFVPQPFDGPRLLARIRTYVQAKIARDTGLGAVLVDEMTGLYNRIGIERRLAELGATAQRRGEPIACLLVRPEAEELEAAAAVLQAFEERLAGQLARLTRKSDMLARSGPLRYVIVAPATGPEAALTLAHRLQTALLAMPGIPPVRIGGYVESVPVSPEPPVWIDRAAEELALTTVDRAIRLRVQREDGSTEFPASSVTS